MNKVKVFDQKFGASYFASLPTTPAVYRIYNARGEIIYVGKAKNLRRRLGQYRNAKRRKKHAKMRKIVGEASSIQYELFPGDHEACMAELRLIQQLRPKFNLAGAFSFLYPLVGLGYVDRELTLFYTTEPETLGADVTKGLSFHGAYRSRHLSWHAFAALAELFEYVGHRNRPQKIGKYSYRYSFRQVDAEWLRDLENYFRGDAAALMENLILALVERPSTRRRAAEIQELFDHLKRFYRFEARVLARMRDALATEYPLPQPRRDLVLLEYGEWRRRQKAAAVAASPSPPPG